MNRTFEMNEKDAIDLSLFLISFIRNILSDKEHERQQPPAQWFKEHRVWKGGGRSKK
jgi:hypothetical protein